MNREEIEAESKSVADDLTQKLELSFGKKQLELIKVIVARAYVSGKIKAKLEEIEGVLK